MAAASGSGARICLQATGPAAQEPARGSGPVRKRLFGLTNGEGNHGEDVKEYYFYLDNVPSHAYMRWLYKYPQAAYPYLDLVTTNRQRSRLESEYELVDTGVFHDSRYCDVEVEYAKATPEDLLIRITVHNRGPEEAPLHVLPTLWFRNTWAVHPHTARPRLWADGGAVRCEHPGLGRRVLRVEGRPELLFCENETNARRLWGAANPTPHVKDGIDERVVHGRTAAVNSELVGMLWTKQYYLFDVDVWLREHRGHPFRPPSRAGVRNERWYHMHNDDVISMPDKWEYLRRYPRLVADEDLTPRERRVLGLVEGTIDGHQRTIEQVAVRFGMTAERIERILVQAREKRDR